MFGIELDLKLPYKSIPGVYLATIFIFSQILTTLLVLKFDNENVASLVY